MGLVVLMMWAAQEGAPPRQVTARAGELIVLRPPAVIREDQRAAVVEFLHEEALDRIVPAMDASDISLVQSRNRLFIKMLAPRAGTVDVIGASGTLYRLHVASAPAEEADTLVQIARADVAAQAPPGPVEFARALRLGIRPPGAVVHDGQGELLANADGVEFRLHRVVRWRAYRGYVILCRNTAGEGRRLDERRFRAEGLVAVGVSRHVLAPGETARLILVFWR